MGSRVEHRVGPPSHRAPHGGDARIRVDGPCAWSGSTLLVADDEGSVGEGPGTGLFVREVRHLSRLALELDGSAPFLCEWSRPRPDLLAFVFVHPELRHFGGGGSGSSGPATTRDEHGLAHRGLSLRLVEALELDRLRATLRIENHARNAARFELAWALDADYADLVEIHEADRPRLAAVAREVEGSSLVLRCEHPELPFTTRATLRAPGAVVAAGDRLATRIELAPGEEVEVELVVEAFDPDRPLDEEERRARTAARERWQRELTELRAPGNPSVERVLARALEDLAWFPLLEGEPDEWRALQAGVPLYPAFFGRDALTAGWQMALFDRGDSLAATLARLGRLQADRFDAWRDAEPGRIPMQVRTGARARLGENPFACYYGDVAAPLMAVVALANLCAWSGDRALVERHFPVARRILEWARSAGDADGDGYIEYETKSSQGATNQGWKDSGDAIVDELGGIVAAPIAPCEVQGYWYSALQLGGLLAWVIGARSEARGLWREARALKRRFNRDFWDERERFFVLALGPDKRPVRSVTSNAGHCLAAGIVARERVDDVARRLLAPDLFSGWGVRTLSSAHPAYNPLSYHNGSIWAVENATICFGLRRYGFDAEALRLAEALFALAELYGSGRIPEAVGGFGRDEHPTPGAYPRANSPQAWNASALPLVVQTLLGLAPYAALHALVVDPVLPEWLPEIELRGLRVGATRATLRFFRSAGGRGRVEVVARDGPLHLVRQPPPESRAGLGARLRALAAVGAKAPAV